jgi:hypothetical protein
MANTPPQYTPAQILEAGQRAEADGRFEHAKQFYRHVVDHYPYSSEFSLARDGLGRLSARGGRAGGQDNAHYARGYDQSAYAEPPDRRPPPSHEGAGWQNDFDYGRNEDSGGRPADENGAPYDAARDRFGHAGGGAPPLPAATDDRRRIQIAPAGYDPGEAVFDDEVYEPRKRYRFGRVLTGLLTFFGIVMLLGGVVLTGLIVAAPAFVVAKLGATPVVPDLLVFVGPVLVVVGFVVCLIGQLARALFDTADATRNAAELQAARLSGRTAYARRAGEG